MRTKIKKIIVFLSVMIFLAGGFLAFKEYRGIKEVQQYDYCVIECNKGYDNSRENLELDEDGKGDKSVLSAIALEYESCLDVCVGAYKKITGKEITPLYKILKKEWQLDTSP